MPLIFSTASSKVSLQLNLTRLSAPSVESQHAIVMNGSVQLSLRQEHKIHGAHFHRGSLESTRSETVQRTDTVVHTVDRVDELTRRPGGLEVVDSTGSKTPRNSSRWVAQILIQMLKFVSS